VKKLLKWLFKLLFLLAVLIGLLLLFRNPLLRVLLEQEIRQATGMEVFIGNLSASLGSPVIRIENLRLFSPPDFDRGTFADLPELYLEYDRAALFHRQVRFRAVRLNLFEIHFVRNKEGANTLQWLRDRNRPGPATPPSRWNLGFAGIDTLTLTLGRFKYTDHRDASRNDELWLGVRNAQVMDVRSSKDLEPFLTRLALEKNLKPVFDQLLAPAAPTPNPPAPHPGKSAPIPPAEAPAK
jgi:uncharacterized protein involved in outer membrane biogenesis